jgi:pyruvate dehydrogenase E2 component (dihydrolipoamide acetyltransferase)
VKVLWGMQDRVVPTRQAHRLPGRIAVHVFEEAGHMLPLEVPDDVAALILESTS